jgi:hypothetical protein
LTPLRSSGLVAHLKNEEKILKMFLQEKSLFLSQGFHQVIYFFNLINKFKESFSLEIFG